MTLEVFSRDIVPIIQSGIMLFGLCTVGLLAYQIIQTSRWNKINSVINYFLQSKHDELEKEFIEKANSLSINLKDNIGEAQAEKIFDNSETCYPARRFLDHLETVSLLINVGAIDEELSYYLFYTRIIHSYKRLLALINIFRKKYDDQQIYCELQTLSSTWNSRLENQKNTQENMRNEIELRIRKISGAKKKI